MSLDVAEIRPFFKQFNEELLSVIAASGSLHDAPAGMEILREGQYVKVVPIVLQGLVKVFTRAEEKELLLYYIDSAQSCIMSFSRRAHPITQPGFCYYRGTIPAITVTSR